MPTFKVVVIGASGVGKTSLRGQYISSRFSTSYRATIGADFITKTLPAPPSAPDDEPITLQIWDTAGQERFSSLASAFFRGADAAILMYDVTAPDTLYALRKWWDEFKDKAPVREEEGFCVAVVGNKVDLVVGGEGEGVVTPAQGARFVRALVPRPDTPPPSPRPAAALTLDADDADEDEDAEAEGDDPLASSELTARPPRPPSPPSPPSPISILRPAHPHRKTPSYSSQVAFSLGGGLASSLGRSRSHSRMRGSRASTATSTLTVYHTPSSSAGASEHWHSAESSFRDSGSVARAHGHAHAGSAPDLHAAAESLSRHAHAGLGKGLPTTALRAGTADSRRVSDATITPASARISAASSAASSTERLHVAPEAEAEADSPYATKANGFPGGWGSVRSAHGWGSNAKAASALVDADGSRRSPPPLDTGVAGDAGPSSSALSPLPYPQHFPWGARVLGSFRTVALAGSDSNATGSEPDNRASGAFAPPGAWGSFRQTKPTTAVAGVGAGRSVESLGAEEGAVDLASPVDAAFPAHANGVVPNGTPDPDAGTSISASTRTRTSARTSRSTANSGSTSTSAPSNTTWLAEPDIPSSGVGAAHFRVSARTGEGVQDVFGWVARRLVEPPQNLGATEEGVGEGEGMGRDSWAGREGWENSHSRAKGGRGGGRGWGGVSLTGAGGGAEARLRGVGGKGEGRCC